MNAWKAVARPERSMTALLLCLSSVLLSLVPTTPTHAAGQLMVAPTRIVFEGRDRSASVNLVNTGDETTTYRISFVNKRMSDIGEFSTVETPLPGEKFADKMVRYSPRIVELPPGQSQTIRLLLRRPANLEAGEYRSHLLFKALPPPADKGIEALSPENRQGLSIQLTPVVGVTIPVIVRQGKTEAEVALSNLQFFPAGAVDKQPVLAMSIERSGNRSVYGDIDVYFHPTNGEERLVGKARGVAVYTPNAIRHIRLRLQAPPGMKLQTGQLRITFQEQPKGRESQFAEAKIAIP